MSVVTVRNLSVETHRALRVRAAQAGRSTEAEIRAILDAAVLPADRVRLGSRLAAIGQEFGGIEFEHLRDSEPAEPANFD